MNEIKAIKKRIYQDKPHKFYVLLITLLMLISMILSLMIYGKYNSNAQIFGYSIVEINSKFTNYINGLFNFKLGNEQQVVNEQISYIYLGNNYYCTDENNVKCLDEGKVLYTENYNNEYSLIIVYSNGVTAQYFELQDLMVKKDDKLSMNDVIGSYEEKFKVIFLRDNKVIKYEEI